MSTIVWLTAKKKHVFVRLCRIALRTENKGPLQRQRDSWLVGVRDLQLYYTRVGGVHFDLPIYIYEIFTLKISAKEWKSHTSSEWATVVLSFK